MTPAYSRVLLTLALAIPVSLATAADLMLAGGTLPVCTSLSQNQCRTTGNWRDDALEEIRFQVGQTRIEAWEHAAKQKLSPGQFALISRLLQVLSEELVTPLNASEFRDRFRQQLIEVDGRKISGEQLYGKMSDPAWYMLRDHFQLPPRSQDGEQLREEVRLHDSSNSEAIEIFKRFVAIARDRNGGEKPLILVSTASSRDPYDALAFYRQVFKQAGARTAWLPLDAAVRQARELEDCQNLSHYQAKVLGSYRREMMDPESYARQQAFCEASHAGVEIIEQASGVFLNGGDQWLTFQALIDTDGNETEELKAIRSRIADGKLILGGTSAGSAVQSTPAMVTNGSVPNSLLRGAFRHSPPPDPGCDLDNTCPEGLQANDLTWHQHGLSTFAQGIVDTHFSERQRQFRLMRLLTDTGISHGIGIDETTAALVTLDSDNKGYSVETIGAGSTWIIDVAEALVDEHAVYSIRNARLFSIPAGHGWDTGSLDEDSGKESLNGEALSPCDTFDPGQSFHALIEALTDNAPERCFEIELDNDKTATGRIRKLADSQTAKDAPRIYRMDLSVKADSVILPAAPDREQQPDTAEGGTDESEQAE